MIFLLIYYFFDNQMVSCKKREVFMKKANTNEPQVSYPAGSRLFIYERLLAILYQQNMISKGTFDKSVQHVERATEQAKKSRKNVLKNRREE